MSAPTPEREALLALTTAGFDEFLSERRSALVEFAEGLGLDDPRGIVDKPDQYLAAADAALRGLTIADEEDRSTLAVFVGYYIAEVLMQHFGGRWSIDESPDSTYFGCYVVGPFSVSESREAFACPPSIAMRFLSEPVGRSLAKVIADIEGELRND